MDHLRRLVTLLPTPRGSSAAALSQTDIVSITNSGGVCLFTVGATITLLTGGETIVVSGSSVSGYNTTHNSVSLVSGTTFKTDQAYTSDATGGTWLAA